MVDPSSEKFVACLVKSLQMLCHGYMEFNDNIEIIGHLNIRIDNCQKLDYIVNEQVSKRGGESTLFHSNSYHSLPPNKSGRGERDRQHSGRFDDDGSVNNHHRLDDSVAALGGGRVQVDLSGPVPVTRSTPAPSPDNFFSTTSSSRHRSHSRDSHLHSVEEEQLSACHTQDHSFNHSSIASKDRGEIELTGSNGGERTEAGSVVTMFKDSASRSRQHSAGQRQDVIVKAEPNELFDCAMDESNDTSREEGVLDASSTSSMLPAAHQSALTAHTGHTMLTTTALGHPGFFDASLTQQDASGACRPTLVQGALVQQILNAQKHAAQHLALPGARFSGPAGVTLAAGATAAATTFGTAMGFGVSPLPPHYPLAFHHLAQTYMHAVWRQGLCHNSSSSSSSSAAASASSATVSLQAWNTAAADPTLQACGALNAVKAGPATTAAAGGSDKGKRTLTPAQRMREYREKLKRNPEVYQRYKQMNALRSRLARMRRSQEQVEKDRQRARQRNLKYRAPGSGLPMDLDLASLAAADGSALDFSTAGSVTPPPTHLLHEPPARLPQHALQDHAINLADAAFPSCSTDDWEPPVTFGEPSESP